MTLLQQPPVESPWEKIDRIETDMVRLPQVECPLIHTFTPGLYSRQITMPAGTFLTSKIHLTEHPYVVSQGAVLVWIDGRVKEIKAPYMGVTMPGTRRVLFTLTETIWTTFHVTDETEVDRIEEQIILKRDEHLLIPEDFKLLVEGAIEGGVQ